jgi:hypothetical protein
MYTKIRAILTLCDVSLPAWATIQASRTRIRKLLEARVMYSNSPFGTPIFALNPENLIARVRQAFSLGVGLLLYVHT